MMEDFPSAAELVPLHYQRVEAEAKVLEEHRIKEEAEFAIRFKEQLISNGFFTPTFMWDRQQLAHNRSSLEAKGYVYLFDTENKNYLSAVALPLPKS